MLYVPLIGSPIKGPFSFDRLIVGVNFCQRLLPLAGDPLHLSYF
jgi:hypothetical protein